MSTNIEGIRFTPRRGRASVMVAAVLLASLVLASACSGEDQPGTTSSPAFTVEPGARGGGGGGPPSPEYVAALRLLPSYPGSRPADARFPDGEGTGEGLLIRYLIESEQATPDDVMKFYFESMPALGWKVEISPTMAVFEKVGDYATMKVVRDVAWQQTFVKDELRVRLVAGELKKSKDDDTVIGTVLHLTIMPVSRAPFPTPHGTPIFSTPPPLPTAAEPIPPIGTGPIITPTLTPGPSGEVEPAATPLLTPTSTPAPVE